MPEFLAKIRRSLKKAGVEPGTRLLIGCSGGPDSVSLLDSLHLLAPELELKLAVACFNHGLRAEAADEVEQVRSLARERFLPFFTGSPQSRDMTGRADQAWAREVRLAFLEKARVESGSNLIALAHTADDQAETVLMRLIRGSGLRGLGGMSLVNRNTVRPMLDVTRREVLAYLKERGVDFAQDPSNRNPKYTRVRIRRTLLPLLIEENPNLVQNLCGLAQNLQEDLECLEELGRHHLGKLAREHEDALVLDRAGFLKLPPGAAKRLVRQALAGLKGDLLSLTRDHVEAVLDLARAGAGEAHLPAGMLALAGPDELVLTLRGSPFLRPLEPLTIQRPGRYRLSTGWTLVVEEVRPPDPIPPDPGVAHMDLDRLSWPLEIRPVQKGDRIRPLGLDGSKKLSDLFIDRKIKRWKRDLIPLVIQDREVAWVAGIAMGSAFALGRDTKNALRIRLIPPET